MGKSSGIASRKIRSAGRRTGERSLFRSGKWSASRGEFCPGRRQGVAVFQRGKFPVGGRLVGCQCTGDSIVEKRGGRRAHARWNHRSEERRGGKECRVR